MSLKDKLIKAAFGKLQKSIGKFKGFLKKPAVLLALKIAAFTLLNKLIDQLRKQIGRNVTDEEALNYVKNNRDLQKLLGEINNDIDESYLNEIVLACENPEYYENDINNFLKSLGDKDLSAEDYINLFNNSDEFDNKTSNSAKAFQAASKIMGIVPWLFLTYVLVLKIKEFFEQNDLPSPRRGKYIQRLIRNVSSLIKQGLKDEKKALKGSFKKIDLKAERKQAEALLKSLKLMDAVISGALLASLVYLNNRKKLQKESIATFQEMSASQICEVVPDAGDPEITPVPLPDTFSCPVNLDENIVPHIPIEVKMEDGISCEVEQDEDPSINEGSRPDIASKALYQNDSSLNMNILVKEGDTIDIRSFMATYNGDKIYPTVNGIVEKVESNKIYVKDIMDPEQTYLEELIKKSQDLYTELNDTKMFLKNYYVNSLLPSLLSVSITDDASANPTKNIFTGVTDEYAAARKAYSQANDIFEKKVKDITGKDNVEKNAKNETLNVIKEQLEEQEKIFYDRLTLIGNAAINKSKITLAKASEFSLFEYYALTLGEPLNSLSDASKIEISFRDIINEFARRRYVIDSYSKKILEDKINDRIKSIEKGISTGNWFKKANEVYSANKKLQDLKDWLQSLADKNNKLNASEKTAAVNGVMFLFEFYLNVDQIVQKYNILKKDTNKKTETVKEGNEILKFTENLWKRYSQLQEDIAFVSKELDNISLTFTTYSIQVINGEQYRFYCIADPSCEPPDEDDPYLSPKSKKGYGDIAYWFKYCSFATLASVVNPATSWSTGFPPPIGPIPFPTVYIPAKAFQTNWGIIVVGLTITGIYPFPWALFVNWSTEHHVPLADPTAVIKREIETLRKELTDQLSQFKKERLKSYLEKAKEDIKIIEGNLKGLQDQKRTIKSEKPKRDRSIKPAEDLDRYAKELYQWTLTMSTLEEQILVTKRINLD